MVQMTADDKVNLVLTNIEKMVASEGGCLNDVKLVPPSLRVAYTPGVNEECPECVPTPEAVQRFLLMSLRIHAPEITEVEVI
ncbi:MAG: hypothetical protein IIB28_00515 [Chloroflexi bacterium]|nr:hypothetical protein [Chloroflexota bacterium]MCH8101616.1 hypothetical protein [Chloroflexota bacterium]